MEDRVTPGIHPQIRLFDFPEEERRIIERLGKEWYVTNGGTELKLGPSSSYRYILIKPVDHFQQMFNIEREMVLIFSSYENFEPRTLDAISAAFKLHQALRLERICAIVVSKDKEIEAKLTELLKNDQESQIVIPFTYHELLKSNADDFFFRNRFKRHFYTRDLFASEAPLKKDLYFFGRTDLVHELVNRHRSNQVSGLFGLRKTGKTSVIFGVQRALERIGAKSVFVDCQNPAFHRSKWNMALYYVLSEIKRQLKLNQRIRPEDQYTEEKASIYFEECITKFSKEVNNSNILIIFDEIENITPGVSPSKHWSEDMDFVYFWQTLRSLFQKLEKVFSYLLVGTNPLCVELERVHGKDNPIFGQIPIEYIPRFDVPQTREMVRRLGRIMGLQFDEVIYSKLTEDFGGHPYLIRHLCSVINSICGSERPATIDKTLYARAKDIFLRDYNHFLEMILNVLNEFFPDEYEMLRYLACGDTKTFDDFAQLSPLYTNHLLGYGILGENQGRFCFQIEAIKEHLLAKSKYQKLNQTQEEMWAEVSERRNSLEKQLRTLCRIQIQSHLGGEQARNCVLQIFGEPRKSKCSALAYKDLFNGNLSGILFSDFEKIISKHWDCFKNAFGPDKDDLLAKLRAINKLRADAHAKEINKDEMQYFRLSIQSIEKSLNDFLG